MRRARLACYSDWSALLVGLSRKPELRNSRLLPGHSGNALHSGEIALVEDGWRAQRVEVKLDGDRLAARGGDAPAARLRVSLSRGDGPPPEGSGPAFRSVRAGRPQGGRRAEAFAQAGRRAKSTKSMLPAFDFRVAPRLPLS
jgi:hypothetical protein